jgi:hypothetical protein
MLQVCCKYVASELSIKSTLLFGIASSGNGFERDNGMILFKMSFRYTCFSQAAKYLLLRMQPELLWF